MKKKWIVPKIEKINIIIDTKEGFSGLTDGDFIDEAS